MERTQDWKYVIMQKKIGTLIKKKPELYKINFI